MKRYGIVMYGLTDLLMHADDILFAEAIKAWHEDPANRGKRVAGDDRSPAWTWTGYLYHNEEVIGMPADNIMTMLREGGTKVTKQGKETYKKQTQGGIVLDQPQFDLYINGSTVGITLIEALIGVENFQEHVDVVTELGFELFVKRAKIGQSKHIRVRPRFRNWELHGSLTVLDEEQTGLYQDVLQTIFNIAGTACGVGDWRPSSKQSSGTFGKFRTEITPL